MTAKDNNTDDNTLFSFKHQNNKTREAKIPVRFSFDHTRENADVVLLIL